MGFDVPDDDGSASPAVLLLLVLLFLLLVLNLHFLIYFILICFVGRATCHRP